MSGARLDSVCSYICDKAGWRVSNLRLQKLLYLAQMFHMGRHNGKRLVDTDFQAWDYGPVSPDLYDRIKCFGSGNIAREMRERVFPDALQFREHDPRKKTMDDICAKFLSWTPGQLVGATHWHKGAWAEFYEPNAHGIAIPDNAILKEYNERQKANR